jgi:hypothetical protein
MPAAMDFFVAPLLFCIFLLFLLAVLSCQTYFSDRAEKRADFFADLPQHLALHLVRVGASTIDGKPLKPWWPPALSEAEFQSFTQRQIQNLVSFGFIANSLRQSINGSSTKAQ